VAEKPFPAFVTDNASEPLRYRRGELYSRDRLGNLGDRTGRLSVVVQPVDEPDQAIDEIADRPDEEHFEVPRCFGWALLLVASILGATGVGHSRKWGPTSRADTNVANFTRILVWNLAIALLAEGHGSYRYLLCVKGVAS